MPNAANASVETLLNGRRVRLVPLESKYMGFLYGLATDSRTSFRWRFRRESLSREDFEARVWPGVLSQFVVVSTRNSSPIGQVVLYDADLHNGHAFIAGLVLPEFQRTGLIVEAFQLFVKYALYNWHFRKIYMEYSEFNAPQFVRALGRGLIVEARLRDHTYYNGRFWDQTICSINATLVD